MTGSDDGARIALLPCPFCGAAPNVTERPNADYEVRKFSCFISCTCDGYSACAHKYATGDAPESARAKAIALWNRRTPSPGITHAAEPYDAGDAHPSPSVGGV